MKSISSRVFFLLLLAVPQFGIAARPEHKCEKDVVELPNEIKLKSPALDYVGKDYQGRPVFYQPQAEVIMVFDKNFTKPDPWMVPWTSSNDKRPCDMLGQNTHCSGLKAFGPRMWFTSLGIKCDNERINQDSPNINVMKTQSQVCLDYDMKAEGTMVKCCEGLELNPNTKKCDEPTLVDPGLKTCSTHSDCEEGQGCLPQRYTDLFTAAADSSLQDILEGQNEEWTEDNATLKAEGQACSHAKECATYSCVSGKCEAKRVCRFADENEFAGTNVRCKEGFDKDAGQKCVPGEGYVPFIGLIDEVTFDKQGQYGFSIDRDTLRMAHEGMMSLRALEWMMSRIPTKNNADCFKMAEHIRKNVAEPMYRKRRALLTNFNKMFRDLETDQKTIEEALRKAQEGTVGDNVVSIHYQPISEKDLATRATSGYDALMIMYRRNAIFQSYEVALRDLSLQAADLFEKMFMAQMKWENNHKSWDLGDGQKIDAFACDAKYEKWKFWKQKWVTRRHSEIKKRWQTWAAIQPEVEGNRTVLQRSNVEMALANNTQKSMEDTKAIFQNKPFILLDPLIYGAQGKLAYDNFGTKWMTTGKKHPFLRDVARSAARVTTAILTLGLSEVFGFFKKTRQTRYVRFFDGKNNGTLEHLRTAMAEDIKTYYKELNDDATDKEFIYEPELTLLEGRGCAVDPEKTGCASYNEFIEKLTDYALGHFLAYSYNTKDDYANYFSNENSARPLLISRLAVDTHNMSSYYNAVVGARETQSQGLLVAMNNIIENFHETADDGRGAIADTQSGSSSSGRGENGITTFGRNPSNGRPFRLNRTTAAPFHMDLLTGKSMNLGATNLDGVASALDRAGAAGVTVGGQAAMAISARAARMKAHNKKAIAKGVDVAGREAALRKNLGVKTNGGAGGAVLGASGAGLGMGTASTSGRATLDAEAASSGNNGPTGALSSDNHGDSGSGRGGYGGGSYSSSEGGRSNSGMSDEEEAVLMSNLDRATGQYQPNEDDGLFDVVSKAYVRNLEKVLTKRKKAGNRP